jgi:hypothetical protein
MDNKTYLTTDELSAHQVRPRTIRERLKDSVLLEGIHYIRPFGGRKILYIWEHIERDMQLLPRLRHPHGKRRCVPWVVFKSARRQGACSGLTSGLPLPGTNRTPDTAANRKKVQKVLDRIEADIAAGTFDYRRYFPASKNAARFDAARRSASP